MIISTDLFFLLGIVNNNIGVNNMIEAIVITPVKDSLETTKQTVEKARVPKLFAKSCRGDSSSTL